MQYCKKCHPMDSRKLLSKLIQVYEKENLRLAKRHFLFSKCSNYIIKYELFTKNGITCVSSLTPPCKMNPNVL